MNTGILNSKKQEGKMNKKIVAFLFLISVFYGAANAAINSDLQRQINNAYDSFKDGQYYRAVNIYETLIKVEKIKNPFVFYNLSNSYYRVGDLANAVLNIEKAYQLNPRDGDIRKNRNFLLSQSGQNISAFSDSLTSLFSLNEITVFSSFILIVLFLSLTLFLFYKKVVLKKIIIVLSAVFVLSVFLTSLKASIVLEDRAVVLTPSVLKSGPSENSADLYNIGEAQIVKIVLETDMWSRIDFVSPDGILDGWIENNRLGKI
ncbi:MAG: tetratricopeptide repeat protein [Elusimicrobiota bacterium]|nr:tetratricopeptide repeat protein [Elusimicrobiota bacterium]